MEALTTTNKNYDLVANRSEALNIFLHSIDIKPSTATAYKKGINKFLDFLAQRNIQQATQKDIIAYKNYLTEQCEAPSINLYLTALKRFYKYLNAHYNIIDYTLELKSEKIKREHKKDGLTLEQVKELLNLEMTKRDKAIIHLLITGALREIEIIRADIQDLTTKNDRYILKVQGKGHSTKDDYIIITNSTYKIINEYLATRKNIKPTDPLIICDSNRNSDGRLTTRSVGRIVKEKLKQIGINTPRITPHSLRHTAITLALLNNNKNLFEAQKFARHSNPATTQIYIDEIADTDAKTKSADILEAIINNAT